MTGLKNLAGAVVIKTIGKTVFLKFPFFRNATYVSFGISFSLTFKYLIAYTKVSIWLFSTYPANLPSIIIGYAC